MQTNQIPRYDLTDNPTGCCPRFQPEVWDDQLLHFEDKPFVRASTVSLFHVPLNMGHVFSKTSQAIAEAHADHGGFLVLSHDDSAWHAEHLFAVAKDVPDVDMVHLSGDYLTQVFEGPYRDMGEWCVQLEAEVIGRGQELQRIYFFYTTCPRCAKVYGKNYVVGVAELG